MQLRGQQRLRLAVVVVASGTPLAAALINVSHFHLSNACGMKDSTSHFSIIDCQYTRIFVSVIYVTISARPEPFFYNNVLLFFVISVTFSGK